MTKKNKIKKKFKFIDLFAGIGGFRIALQNLGGECVYSSEWDEHSKKTYAANFYEIPDGDINKADFNKIKAHDILTAGFPCQPFSSIGKRQGFKHPTQGTLFYSIRELILAQINKGTKPKVLFLENVPGLKTHDNHRTFEIIEKVLTEELNYKTFIEILNAADFGLPQNRKRLYFVCFDRDYFKDLDIDFQFPEPLKDKRYINQFLEKNIDGYSITEHLQKAYLFKKDDGHPAVVDENSQVQIKTLVASYHKIQRLTGTYVKDGPTGLRLFSENECKAIMGFPKDFKVPVSRTQMYRQFGNSVAVPLIEKIGEQIVKTIENLENELNLSHSQENIGNNNSSEELSVSLNNLALETGS